MHDKSQVRPISTLCLYRYVGQKSDTPLIYVNIMPYKLQNTTYLYCLNTLTFAIIAIIHSLNVLIYLKTFS